MFHALVDVDALVVGLRVAFGTDALVTAGCVGALVFAIMLTCGALIQVATRNTVRIKNVAFGTRTNEAALRVLTRELARCWIQFALVDVNTSGSAVVRPVSLVAHATVRAKRVDALSMAAQIGDRVALVDVVSVDRVSDLEAELFVFFAVFARTVFAHGSPSGAHGTATISLRHLHQAVRVCGAHAI